MAFAQYKWAVVMRITESSPLPAGTADFTLTYWVTGADTTARRTNAEACAREQCKNMLSASGRTTVVLSSSQVGTR